MVPALQWHAGPRAQRTATGSSAALAQHTPRAVSCREWQRQLDRVAAGRRVGMLWLDLSECLAVLRATLDTALATLCGVLEIAAHGQLAAALAQVQVCTSAQSVASAAGLGAAVRCLTEMLCNKHVAAEACKVQA